MTCPLCSFDRGHAPDCPNVPAVRCTRCGESPRTTLEQLWHAEEHEAKRQTLEHVSANPPRNS
jgi:hypothetical protein